MGDAKQKDQLSNEERSLGMGAPITRRDFVNTTLVGVGSGLLGAAAPMHAFKDIPAVGMQQKDPWYGYGARGDYARASGNTREVAAAAHLIRDGQYNKADLGASETGEVYDLIVVGGGMSGLGAAHYFQKHAGAGQTCLILENHPIFGGEAKENEFLVNGHRLIAPQGSNDFGPPAVGSGSVMDAIYTDLKIPRRYEFEPWGSSRPPLKASKDNYGHMTGIAESQVDIGYWFEDERGRGRWINNIWRDDLQRTPFPEATRRELLRWRYSQGQATEDFRRKLDSMSYKDFLEKELKLPPECTRMAEPVVGLINGCSPDAVSAFASGQIGMPGAAGRVRGKDASLPLSFPGGNGAFARFFMKGLIPTSIAGAQDFADVLTRPVNFAELDKRGHRIRMRLGATVIRVEHDGPVERAKSVWVTYEQGGKLYRVKARGVVMSSGGWVNRHVIRDLPEDIKTAYGTFFHSPALIVNVALTNWRFLHRLGITAADWFGKGFGFSANIRQPMVVGNYRQPFDPDKPTVLTFYMGVYTPGMPLKEQSVQGRWTLFGTPFADYERRIRSQMATQFGSAGFDPSRDIAGIILNRWGHARLVQQPGFYFGTEGKTAPRKIVERGFGRIAIGHSELNGHQSVSGAIQQGYRAVEQVLALRS